MIPVKIHISFLGKIEREYRSIVEFYESRISSMARFHRDSGKLSRETILLDSGGEMLTDREFQELLRKMAGDGMEIHFAVGPPEGFDARTKKEHRAISLSPMTMRHELAYLVLLEQIYRALLGMKGTDYSK